MRKTLVCLLLAMTILLFIPMARATTKSSPKASPKSPAKPSAKSKLKFPVSTILCGIMSQDRFSKVKKLYGLNAKPVNMSVSAEAETYTLIYNDPKFDAHILIDSGEGISVSKVGLSFDGKIYGGVALMTGRIKGKHFASKSFARMGNYYGITLGDSLEKIKHYYPKAKVFPEKKR